MERNIASAPTQHETQNSIVSKAAQKPDDAYLSINTIHLGDTTLLLDYVHRESIALSIWSPPYNLGKNYELGMTFDQWQKLIRTTINKHTPILISGGFLVINIADILCFKDKDMPRIQAETLGRRKYNITKEDIEEVLNEHPSYNKYDLASYFNCSEQTIDRRLHGNNIRGGKYETQTRVKLVGGLIEEWALDSGLYLYDRRIWVKDPAWQNSKWASLSYRAVDEFEYLYVFWKPGIVKHNRKRLEAQEWTKWGSRAVWNIASVKSNDCHEAMFPVELPYRMIRLLTEPNDIVLDCFMGSGSTAIAALKANRRYIGIDKEAEYVKLANSRVSSYLGGRGK